MCGLDLTQHTLTAALLGRAVPARIRGGLGQGYAAARRCAFFIFVSPNADWAAEDPPRSSPVGIASQCVGTWQAVMPGRLLGRSCFYPNVIIPLTPPTADLPLVLPPTSQFRPNGTGDGPLASLTDWVRTVDPETGVPALRETNTMPQACSLPAWCFATYASLSGRVAVGTTSGAFESEDGGRRFVFHSHLTHAFILPQICGPDKRAGAGWCRRGAILDGRHGR